MARGDDMEIEIEVTLLEAAKGCKREIEIERHVPATTAGQRRAPEQTAELSGLWRAWSGRAPAGLLRHQHHLPSVSGQGQRDCRQVLDVSRLGRVPKKGTVNLTIPAGIDDGQKLRLSGQGDPSPSAGGEAGDLYVHIHVKADPRFVRDGDNLWVDAKLSFCDATLGCRLEVPTPDGLETVTVAPGTQPMSRHVLRGRGMPNVRGRGQGDLIVRFVVDVPPATSALSRGPRAPREAGAPHRPVAERDLPSERCQPRGSRRRRAGRRRREGAGTYRPNLAGP